MKIRKSIGVILAILMVVTSIAWNKGRAADVYYDIPTSSYPTIQSAIDAVMAVPTGPNDTACLRVAQGTYEENLIIKPQVNGVFHVYLAGGYSSDFQTRTLDPVNTVIDGTDSGTVIYIPDPVLLDDVQLIMTIEGFTVTGGNGAYGGGIRANQRAGYELTFDHMIFEKNKAGSFGGGLRISSYGSVTIDNCIISDNTAKYGAGIDLAVRSNGVVGVLNSIIEDNTDNQLEGSGAGIYLVVYDTATSTIRDNVIKGNMAGNHAGFDMKSHSNSRIIITNNLIHGNQALGENAGGGGGALYVSDDGQILFSSNTVTENQAPLSAGGVSGMQRDSGVINSTDSIIWDNSTSGGFAANVHVSTGYSDPHLELIAFDHCLFNNIYPTSGWSDAGGNITGDTIDPLFSAGPAGNFFLSQAEAGQSETSPCVDAGSDTAVNLDLDQRATRTDLIVDTGIVDIGYHYPAGGVQPVAGDADGDGDVDGSDMAGFSGAYPSSPDDPNYVAAFDLDGVHGIGEGDLAIFASHFGG